MPTQHEHCLLLFVILAVNSFYVELHALTEASRFLCALANTL